MKSSDKLALLSIAIGAVPGLYIGSQLGLWWGMLLCLIVAGGIWQWLLKFTLKVRIVDAKILKD